MASVTSKSPEQAPWTDLPAEFAAWWWQSPRRAQGTTGKSLLAQRCSPDDSKPGLSAFGMVKDWSWFSMALMPQAQRVECIQLYAVMLSPGSPHMLERLAQWDVQDKQWALAIGSIQPLPRRLDWSQLAEYDSNLLGFAELGLWIQEEFPALWDRLVLMSDPSDVDALCHLMQPYSISPVMNNGVRQRVKRCWALAKHRTESRHGIHSRAATTS